MVVAAAEAAVATLMTAMNLCFASADNPRSMMTSYGCRATRVASGITLHVSDWIPTTSCPCRRTFARRARTLTVRSHVVCACVLACLLACVCVRACLRVCVRACLRMYGCRQLSMGAVCFVGVVRVCAGPRLLAV